MIDTSANIKTILDISDSNSDNKIALLMPIIETLIHSYTKNNFIDNTFEISNYGSDISFDVSSNRISDVSAGFGDFQSNMTIKVFNSKFNDGVYTIQAANASYLDLSGSYGTLKFDEAAGNGISIYKVTYPDDLKLVFAQMIGFDLEAKYGVKREKVDIYEVEFAENGFQYPQYIVSALQKYKKVYPDKI